MPGVALANAWTVSAEGGQPHGGEVGRGEAVHRAVYRSIGRLPRAVRSRVLGAAFDTLFGLTADVWRYDSSPYEATKRADLMGSIPAMRRSSLSSDAPTDTTWRPWPAAAQPVT